MTRFLTFLIVAFSFSVVGADERQNSNQPKQPGPKLSESEKQFEQLLSGATLVGNFTITGKATDKLSEEKYTISKVEKVADKEDTWRFFVRIQYGKYDVNLPLDLPVRWAGDTPMISLTDFAMPPLGTFSARVFFHRGLYAGTWQHGKVGGHLFGRIVPIKADSKSEQLKN